MEPIVFSIILTFLGFVILYFVIKGAVRAGIREAYDELNVYLRNLITNGINEANLPEQIAEAKEQKEETHG